MTAAPAAAAPAAAAPATGHPDSAGHPADRPAQAISPSPSPRWPATAATTALRSSATNRPGGCTDLVIARTTTCSAPGCRRPAARCDLDHTIAYDHGGRSCECNLAPLCRHHHRCKQAEGWRLEQITPGIMRWTTPAGREYTTTPTNYY